jgi:hypothetical protein
MAGSRDNRIRPDDLSFAPKVTHDARRLDGQVELLLARVEVQDAFGQVVVLNPGVLPQLLKTCAAVSA